jgi:uncharacterized protein YbjT (DUF2867 family)
VKAPPRILLAGASGLVGARILRRLLDAPAAPWVLAPTRRLLDVSSRRLTVLQADLADPGQDGLLAARLRELTPKLDAYVCALGTTIRRAGSREAFLAVDRDLVLRLATLAHDLGARHAILVSSVGASAQSGNFYLRVKGETERALADLGFERVDFLRPGLLLGDRAEARTGEAIAKTLTPLTNRLLHGPLRRYRGIEADDVAAAAVALLDQHAPGRHVHENAGLLALARS